MACCVPITKKPKETWCSKTRIIAYDLSSNYPVTTLLTSVTSVYDDLDYSTNYLVFTTSQIDLDANNISSAYDSSATVACGNSILSSVTLSPFGNIYNNTISPLTLNQPLVLDFFVIVNTDGSLLYDIPMASTPPTFSYTFPAGTYFGYPSDYLNMGAGGHSDQYYLYPFTPVTYQLQNPISIKTGNSYTTFLRLSYNGYSDDLADTDFDGFFSFSLSYGFILV